ncbi:MAG TPA: calcium sensor EFh [Pseudomonas sp.]|nr:calcium sensor EFh [Pseudomonas sp.]
MSLARLYEIVDNDKDSVLTGNEMRAALKKPWQAQVLGQLITRYESEWFWNKAKWDELDRLLADEGGQENAVWEVEKKRIEKLSWWGELAGQQGISADGRAWHFYPLGILVGLLIAKGGGSVREGKITFDAEGNNVPDSPFFSRVIHWPGNELSGVTLGRGYDMGSRSEAEIYGHMIASGIESEQAAKISRSHGLKGESARQFVVNNKVDIGEITLEQEVYLFNLIYPDYIGRAVNNYNYWTSSETGRIEWSSLDQVIRDVLVDFVYQGFTKGPNPMRAGMNNDRSQLVRYIEGTPAIRQYEPGRRRARYLRGN